MTKNTQKLRGNHLDITLELLKNYLGNNEKILNMTLETNLRIVLQSLWVHLGFIPNCLRQLMNY